MTVTDEIAHLLKTHGAVLDRHAKHKVWRFPDGRIFVHASTPSDRRSDQNSLAELRRLLGIEREIHKNPERKKKKGAAPQVFSVEHPQVSLRQDWKEKLLELTAFHPQPCCCPVRLERIPMTPVWCILRNVLGYGGRA